MSAKVMLSGRAKIDFESFAEESKIERPFELRSPFLMALIMQWLDNEKIFIVPSYSNAKCKWCCVVQQLENCHFTFSWRFTRSDSIEDAITIANALYNKDF